MQTKRQKLISERKAKDEADQLEKNRVQQRLLALEAWRKQQQSLKVSYKSPDLLARSLTAFFRNVFAGGSDRDEPGFGEAPTKTRRKGLFKEPFDAIDD